MDPKDSIELINAYVTKWIKQQLLLAEAEKHLSNEELKIKNELKKNHQELLIHKYNTKEINKIVENDISFSDIEKYYKNHLKSFILDYAIVRVKYLIFPIAIEIKPTFRNSLRSKNEKVIAENEDFIFKYAKKYDDFNNNWLYFEKLIKSVEYEIDNCNNFLAKNNLIEFTTNNELHLISIEEHLLPGNQAPLDFVSPQIKSLIINNKKLDFLREIKDSLYNDALKYNKFRVFN